MGVRRVFRPVGRFIGFDASVRGFEHGLQNGRADAGLGIFHGRKIEIVSVRMPTDGEAVLAGGLRQ